MFIYPLPSKKFYLDYFICIMQQCQGFVSTSDCCRGCTSLLNTNSCSKGISLKVAFSLKNKRRVKETQNFKLETLFLSMRTETVSCYSNINLSISHMDLNLPLPHLVQANFAMNRYTILMSHIVPHHCCRVILHNVFIIACDLKRNREVQGYRT